MWSPPDEQRMELRVLIRRREELVAMRTAEKNRSQAPGIRGVLQQSLARILKMIQKEINRIDQEIKTLLDSSHELQQTLHIMTSISGIGELTATKLLALLPEIGQLPRKQITALAGLAPHPKDSGTYRGYRRIRGGRKEIKRILFLSAITAAHHEEKFQQYYQRQLLKGKSKKSVLSAIMAKIVITLNARIRDFFREKQLAFQQS